MNSVNSKNTILIGRNETKEEKKTNIFLWNEIDLYFLYLNMYSV